MFETVNNILKYTIGSVVVFSKNIDISENLTKTNSSDLFGIDDISQYYELIRDFYDFKIDPIVRYYTILDEGILLISTKTTSM